MASNESRLKQNLWVKEAMIRERARFDATHQPSAGRIDAVRTYISQHKKPVSSEEIGQSIGTTPQKIRLILAKLKNDGAIERIGNGAQSLWQTKAKK